MMTVNRIQRLLDGLQHSPWDSLLTASQLDPFRWPLTTTSIHQPRIWRSEEKVVIELDLPGRCIDDLEVSTERDRVTIDIRGQSSQPEGRPILQERTQQDDHAEFRLPFVVNPELTDVVFQNGILRIAIQKPEAEQARRLEVRQA